MRPGRTSSWPIIRQGLAWRNIALTSMVNDRCGPDFYVPPAAGLPAAIKVSVAMTSSFFLKAAAG